MNSETEVKKKKKNYLNNSDLLEEIKKSREQGKVTEKLGTMFMALVKKYATIPRFSGYTYNEDMQAFALLTLTRVWKSFDETTYDNPFAYFTRIVHNAFHQFDNMERKQRDIRDALLVENGKNPSFNYAERYDDEHVLITADDDSDIMEYFDKHDVSRENVKTIDTYEDDSGFYKLETESREIINDDVLEPDLLDSLETDICDVVHTDDIFYKD